MAGTLTLTAAELRRLFRNRRYFVLTVAFPVVAVPAGRQIGEVDRLRRRVRRLLHGRDGHVRRLRGALNGNAIRISQDKKEGWIRQLRLTPLPANAYVVAKVLTSLATTGTSIVIVMLLGRFYGNVHLPGWEWPAIAVTVWFGSTIFAALAVAVGYRFAPDQVQPVTLILYFVFAILGGLWFPLGGVLGRIGQLTPTYEAVKIGTDVIGGASVPVGYPVGLVIWLGIFIALATVAVRATAETV